MKALINPVYLVRAIAVVSVLSVIVLLPQHADAQCALSYGDASQDGTNVYAWNTVIDYYNQSGCSQGYWGFVHGYYAWTNIQSPSGRTASGSGSSSAWGGGGYTQSLSALDIAWEWGEFTFSRSELIYCSVMGAYIFNGSGGGGVYVAPDSMTFSNVDIDELGNGHFTVTTGGSGQSKQLAVSVQTSGGSVLPLYSGSAGVVSVQLQFLENQEDHVPAGTYATLLGTYGTASAQAQINQAVVAIPVNFRKTAQGANGQPPNGPGAGLIAFQYAWDSSTRTANNLRAGDIAACTVGESVWYPGPGPTYEWRRPPYQDPATGNTVSTNNPNDANVIINPRPGSDLALEDVHYGVDYLMPSATYDPGAAHEFRTEQVYAFRCPNYQGGNAQAFTGHLVITRTVSQNGNGTWKYEIYKDSQTGTLNPIP